MSMDHYSLPDWDNSDEQYDFDQSSDSYSLPRNVIDDNSRFRSYLDRPYSSTSALQRDKVSFRQDISNRSDGDSEIASSRGLKSSRQKNDRSGMPSGSTSEFKDDNNRYYNRHYADQGSKIHQSSSSGAGQSSSRNSYHESSSLPPRHSSKEASRQSETSQSKLSSSSKSIDVLEVKSWLLAQSEKFGVGIDAMTNLKKHISNKVELDKKMIETHLTPLNTRFRSAAHYSTLPREASLLEEKWEEFLNVVRAVLQESSECFQSNKVAYQAQLHKVRDNANTAIRNAMQIERSETLQTCQNVRDDAAQQLRVSHESHSQETTRLKETLQTLELTMNHLEQRNQVLQEKEHQRLTLQQNAVKEALQLQRQEHVQDIQRQQEHFVKEKESLKQEYTRMIEKLSETHAQREDEHRRIEENFRFEAKRTASQHEQEISRLRDEYQILQSQLTLVKEKTQHQLQEERTMHEKSLSEQLAASLKTHAATKTEMATMLQQLHLEENKRRQETELQFNRLREQMLAQHQVELEQLRDKQARELKRARAELEVQFEDQANKLKHMHEQELNRQIRITDRFQRVFARHGLGPSAKNSASSEEVSPAALRTLQQAMSQEFQHSLTPKRLRQQQRLARQPLNTSTTSLATRGENFPSAPAWNNPVGSQAGGEEDDDEEEEEIDVLPPPPPPASYMSRGFTNTKTRGKPPSAVSSFAAAAAVTNTNAISTTSSSQNHGTSSLNWGALSDSLRAQGASAPSSSSSSSNSHGTFSPQHPPPNTFALDEAVASSSNPQVTQKGLGITANVRRMSSYLQALEDYLQGDETAAQDVNISIATSTALSDILNVPVSSAAIQTAVPLGQDKKAGPQASRKTENSDKLRDSLATSTNNTVSVVDEDTNSTGSLLRHLRGLHQTSTSTVDEVAMRDAGAKEEDDDGDEASYGDDAADWMYVASDSEDSLHRAARSSGFQTQLKTMTATTQQPNPSVLSSISSTGPLLTTVLSDS